MNDDENKRAYNALLTLLKDDDAPSRKKIKRSAPVSEPKPSSEQTVENVEGMDDQPGAENNGAVQEESEDEEIQVEDDNEGDQHDPFEQHFASPPRFEGQMSWKSHVVSSLPLLGERSFAQLADNSPLQPPKYSPISAKQAFTKIKHRLQVPFFKSNHSDKPNQLTSLQTQLAVPLFNYQDMFITQRNWHNYDEYLDLLSLHLVNHIYKTRDRVLKNNTKIKEVQKRNAEKRAQLKEKRLRKRIAEQTKAEKNESVSDNDNDSDNGSENESADEEFEEEEIEEYRDQGFTRPKVLILVPTRDAAFKFMDRIIKISGINQAENKKRFYEAFKAEDSDLSAKPEDFQHLFAGNTNEVFCLGVKFTRQALKFYSSFYASDLIIASPLGLRLIVDKKDYDFLSSIELCICDQLEAIAMQSWTNIKHVFDKLNAIPRNPHDCDFSRVREWALDDKSKFLRQTVLLSEFATPEMVGLFNKQCVNIAGKFRCRSAYPGVISSLRIHIRQIFTRVGVSDFTQDSKQRFDHFTNGLLPSLMRGAQTDGIMVVAPNYTDFVMLRNYLEKNDFSYVSLSEYTAPSQLGRGRTFFADGRAKMLLYSARLHHYRRYGIKGTRTIVFYGLPDNPLFYQEFVRSLARTVIDQQVDPDLLKVHVLFSKWDALKLERVVGTQRMAALIEGNNDQHEFY